MSVSTSSPYPSSGEVVSRVGGATDKSGGSISPTVNRDTSKPISPSRVIRRIAPVSSSTSSSNTASSSAPFQSKSPDVQTGSPGHDPASEINELAVVEVRDATAFEAAFHVAIDVRVFFEGLHLGIPDQARLALHRHLGEIGPLDHP
ncbi:MAG: hypothetical protein LC722_01580 [Actinobacteria bacterium]|nr:hypothetical protein [Actinomycetota bacterium]